MYRVETQIKSRTLRKHIAWFGRQSWYNTTYMTVTYTMTIHVLPNDTYAYVMCTNVCGIICVK